MNKNSSRAAGLVALVAMTVGSPRIASAAWTNGQAAVGVIGQSTFTSNTANAGGISASTLNGPTNVCSDPVHGKLYVMDYINNRVLRYDVAAAVGMGAAAEAVLGQPDFTTMTAAVTAAKMTYPESCAISATGTLYVGDNASRVLRFDNAHLKANGANADGVLGSADFTTPGASGPTASTVGGLLPLGLALSASGSLFVSDYPHNRVLRFDNAASKANGAAADGVLGQPDFVSGSHTAASASSVGNPYGLAIDGSNALYVADDGNHRVLRFDNATTKSNGAAADGVLGASDFTTVSNGATSASTFSTEFYSVGLGPDGALYVGDFNSRRMMIFDNAATKANGAAADHVLGAPDFTTPGTGTSATSLSSTLGLGFSTTGYFFVGDYGNNRVMVYANAALVVGAPGAPAIASVAPGNAQATVTFTAPAADGNSAITGYTVTSDPAGGTDLDADTTGLSHIITGLTSGTAYTFTVTATTTAGTSSASGASSSVIPAGVPDAPITIVAAAIDPDHATVTFQPPVSNGGSAISGYTVTSDPAGGIDTNAGSMALSHLVTGLTRGIAYTFTVTATNSAGTSAPSVKSNPVTPPLPAVVGPLEEIPSPAKAQATTPSPEQVTLDNGGCGCRVASTTRSSRSGSLAMVAFAALVLAARARRRSARASK